MFCLYDITCMFVRADHLVQDNQLVCSSLKKTNSPTRSFPVSHMVGLRLMGLSHHSGMSIGIVLSQLMFGQSCRWDFMWVASDITRRHSLWCLSLTFMDLAHSGYVSVMSLLLPSVARIITLFYSEGFVSSFNCVLSVH